MTIVGAYVDEGLISLPEMEYDEIENFMIDTLAIKFTFKEDIIPSEVINNRLDFYVFDFGGIAQTGASGLARNFARSIQKAIIEKPNTLFIVWTDMTANQIWTNFNLMDFYRKEMKEICDAPNIAFAFKSSDFEKINKWRVS